MKGIRLGFWTLLATLVVFTGCAGRTQSSRQINALQAQVGVLTDELVRLDQQLQTARATAQDEQNYAGTAASISPVGGAAYAGSMYRTPSGFEVPAISIQQALKNAGYYNGPVDGKVGPQTRKAVQAFQRDNGLTADGVIGRNTWNRLKIYSAAEK